MVTGRADQFASYFNGDEYIQHNAWFPDRLSDTMGVVLDWANRHVFVTYDAAGCVPVRITRPAMPQA